MAFPSTVSKNVTADDFINTKFISAEEHARLIRRCKPERGDILMTRITAGVLGDTRIIDWDVNASIYVSLALLKPNDRVVPEYLYRYSRSTAFVRGVERRGLANATPKKINMRDISAIPIPVLSSEAEQRAIATALSDVDGLLGGLDRLIAKKRDLKQATMQQLLTGQTRLPGFHGEWEVRRLGAVCRITIGKKDVNEGNPNGQFPFFTCSRTHTFSDSYSFDAEAILIAGNGEVGNLHYINGKFEAYQRTYVLCAFSAHVRDLWQQLNAYLADSLGLGKIGSSIPYIKKRI
ncbi:MAG: restriction endonuclease subunit S [Ignavibacteria bacterium]|nr:restriction endonuclease subunit S [Ignavibacteria bacterium]